MVDLVVTCPKGFWKEWIAEGDAAGEPLTGTEWGWYMGGARPPIGPGDRLYIAAWGRLRGWAPVTRLTALSFDKAHGGDGGLIGDYVDASLVKHSLRWCICREGGAHAVTIAEPIPGFRGYRKVWWRREAEVPFLYWKTEGVGACPLPKPAVSGDWIGEGLGRC